MSCGCRCRWSPLTANSVDTTLPLAPPGRERVQSAGRACKFGSRFVEIIEASHEELSLIRKSRTEEANMRAAVRALSALGLAS